MARAKPAPASAQSSATIGFEAKLSRTLATLRDPAIAGLPKLPSGELRVAEAAT